MKRFQRKKIPAAASLGQRLRACREAKHYGISRLAQEASISKNYLLALENGAYRQLPSEVFIRHALKKIAKELCLSSADIICQFENEYQLYAASLGEAVNERSGYKKPRVLVLTRWLMILLIVFTTIVAGGYLVWRTIGLFSPPRLIINAPPPNYVTNNGVVVIVGQTEPETLVNINGVELWSDSLGNFRDQLTTREGLNNIIITVKKRFGGERQIIRRVIYQP